ncbi:alanine aminotransferase 1-like [Manacus candei]|uniref:alanine aminotransferase 1-like n=1 Tax=Manacus candei TaxID=415023 RepID=UPI002225F0E4|nr:alanine aminotransferase 1-like [Manacus candei]
MWIWGHPGDTVEVALGPPFGPPVAACPAQDVLSLLVDPRSALPTGVLVPEPGPPLAALAAGLAGAVPIPYPREGSRERAPDVAAIRRQLRDARGRCAPKVLWVVNPGGPSGPVLSLPSLLALLSLAFEERLLLLADEVHQEGSPSPFVSFRRALAEAGPPLCSSVQLVSFYSLSKGMAGGGIRAGFFDLVNVDRRVLRGFYTWGLSVYPPVLGMAMLDVAMDTPRAPHSAYGAMQEHRRALSQSLSRNSQWVPDVLAVAGAGPAAPPPLPKPFPAGTIPRDTEPGTAPRNPRDGGGLGGSIDGL